MVGADSPQSRFPLLVIAYVDQARELLVRNLQQYGSRVAPCASFCEAETLALGERCRGVLVDLTAMIKAKSEEKIVAYTLTRCYPTLKVRVMGPMIIPMMMAGEAQQDRSLNDFVSKTCAGFTPRSLRRQKRREICIPTFIGEKRGFTLNISWCGTFIADTDPERFLIGQTLQVHWPDFGLDVAVTVTRIQHWGEHRPPGIGVEFLGLTPDLENSLYALLQSDRMMDKDRMIT